MQGLVYYEERIVQSNLWNLCSCNSYEKRKEWAWAQDTSAHKIKASRNAQRMSLAALSPDSHGSGDWSHWGGRGGAPDIPLFTNVTWSTSSNFNKLTSQIYQRFRAHQPYLATLFKANSNHQSDWPTHLWPCWTVYGAMAYMLLWHPSHARTHIILTMSL